MILNFFHLASSNKRILGTIILVAAATIVDSLLITIFGLTNMNLDLTSTLSLFISILTVCVLGQFIILKNVRQTSKDAREKSILRIKVAFTAVPMVQYIITGILVFVVLQMLVTSSYTISLVIATIAISYTMGICMLGLLAHHLISWFKSSRNVVVLFYGLSSLMLALNIALTFVIATVLLQAVPPEIGGGLITSSASFSTFGEFLNMLNPVFIFSSISSFIMTWIATSMLLRHYSRKFGKMKYWTIVGLPLIYFLSQFLSLSLNLWSGLQASNPVLWSTVISLAFVLTKPVGGILFGIAFWLITKNIQKNSLVRSYMIISASGLVLLFTCNQAIAMTGVGREIPYPPFGIASVSLIGFSCYLILVGIYFSAVSLSADSSLRQSIRDLTIGESRLLDSIGMAQMEQEIQRRVVVLVKQSQDSMAEESGVESSLTDEDITEYLEEVIKEIKEAKEK